ncbi:hypothetical protein N7448_003314 [Penicillium atrosanguineum]|uniref:Uncharacterized protein n=1 Tax=Penicillium atrosanguineum TaxID=1132637 RepID=A0A9W9PVR2_9EURO|nr:uncharacterized protein N7443_002284 [Penicillium atrosanguineum]KAJ5139906.1 hypothetical protein N7448_003314 [Penicillium atrosanguineum]KAJ5309823.1 hypothetical protein N7443_002284 [Penicillium atrosanguineum]KAJ5315342.1 hypothetical protein N7476_005649 [Penicillium atrosanguineum]
MDSVQSNPAQSPSDVVDPIGKIFPQADESARHTEARKAQHTLGMEAVESIDSISKILKEQVLF